MVDRWEGERKGRGKGGDWMEGDEGRWKGLGWEEWSVRWRRMDGWGDGATGERERGGIYLPIYRLCESCVRWGKIFPRAAAERRELPAMRCVRCALRAVELSNPSRTPCLPASLPPVPLLNSAYGTAPYLRRSLPAYHPSLRPSSHHVPCALETLFRNIFPVK